MTYSLIDSSAMPSIRYFLTSVCVILSSLPIAQIASAAGAPPANKPSVVITSALVPVLVMASTSTRLCGEKDTVAALPESSFTLEAIS